MVSVTQSYTVEVIHWTEVTTLGYGPLGADEIGPLELIADEAGALSLGTAETETEAETDTGTLGAAELAGTDSVLDSSAQYSELLETGTSELTSLGAAETEAEAEAETEAGTEADTEAETEAGTPELASELGAAELETISDSVLDSSSQ
jgi:hypothetical protein